MTMTAEVEKLDPWERCQISAAWHELEGKTLDIGIGRLGDRLNELIESDPAKLKQQLLQLRRIQSAKGFWVCVKTIDKAIGLCGGKSLISEPRIQLLQEHIDSAFGQLLNQVKFRLEQKGAGAFLSCEEYQQVIEAEVAELREATEVSGKDGKIWELLDIAWVCIFAIASHEAGGIEE